MEKHYPFVAGFKRENEKAIYVPNCSTYNGFLCRLSSKKVKGIWVNICLPIWNSRKITADKQPKNHTMEEAIEKFPDFLIRFGKVEGQYWTWNEDAKERRKLEEGKTVFTYTKKYDEYDDEGDLRINIKKYPREVIEIIERHCGKNQKYSFYEINNFNSLSTDLKNIGWSIK